MIKTINGIVLLLTPFLFLFDFKNKIFGFTYILSLLMASHLILSIITQAFGIFNYRVDA